MQAIKKPDDLEKLSDDEQEKMILANDLCSGGVDKF
jgi:hypothetical protein